MINNCQLEEKNWLIIIEVAVKMIRVDLMHMKMEEEEWGKPKKKPG